MTTIDWALYTEQAAGKGAPVLADVINRPLREVLTLSGIDPDGAFPGFLKVGGALSGNLAGNATTATALSSARTFAITGDVAGNVSADLSAGMSITVTLGTAVVSNANVSLTAAIAYSKLALTGSIVNADIAAGAGIVDTKLATISTAGKVANGATTATATNAVSTIVLRDGSGNFAAGAITATSFAGDGSSLTSLAAGAIASGTLAAARLAGSYAGITGVGTLTAGVWTATVIGPTFGGTGLNAVAVGDLLYGSATNTWARLAGNSLVARKFLVQAGDNTNAAAPSWGLPTAAEVSAGTFAGAFTFAGAVTLQTTVTTTMGTLGAGSTPASSSSATWNNASTVFVHDDVAITNTTSDTNSLVMRHRVNGSTVFSVGVAGHIEAAAEFRSVSPGTHTPEFLSVAGTYPVPDANTVVTRMYSQIGPSGFGVVGTFTAHDLRVVVGDVAAMILRSTQSVVAGKGLLATSASSGFLYVPTCAGTPTGAPTAESGFAAVVWDTAAHKFWGYDGGAWH